MKFWQPFVLVLTCAALLRPATGLAAAPERAAIFGFEFDDTSPEPPRPDEIARLHMLDTELRDLLSQSGQYTPVNIAPVATEAKARDLWTCNGCETALARQVGAQVSVIGWVQKVSNLILNINLVIRDVSTGQMLHAGSVDIRGNTDESWSRGLRYLVQNRILSQPGAAQ
jgi:hypothetical protein